MTAMVVLPSQDFLIVVVIGTIIAIALAEDDIEFVIYQYIDNNEGNFQSQFKFYPESGSIIIKLCLLDKVLKIRAQILPNFMLSLML